MSDKTFLGMNIEGDCYPRSVNATEQYPQEHFQAAVARILNHPEVVGIAWQQYTPYFNDGEPCVFSVGEPHFCFVGVEVPEDDGHHFYDYSWQEEEAENGRLWIGEWDHRDIFQKVVGNTDKVYGDEKWPTPRSWKWVHGPEEAPNPGLFADITFFISCMNGGNYDHACLELFGDHVTIKIDKEAGKVFVEEYEHD